MFETYLVSFGVAVRPIWVAAEKYSRISRHAESSAALPRWHSSMTIRSKNPGENSRNSFLALLRAGNGLIEAEIDFIGSVDPALFVEGQSKFHSVPSCRSMVLLPVLSFAIAAPKGRKSFTIVWSISTLRSARKRMRFFLPP